MHTHTHTHARAFSLVVSQEKEALETKHASEIAALQLNAENEMSSFKKKMEANATQAQETIDELTQEKERLTTALDNKEVRVVASCMRWHLEPHGWHTNPNGGAVDFCICMYVRVRLFVTGPSACLHRAHQRQRWKRQKQHSKVPSENVTRLRPAWRRHAPLWSRRRKSCPNWRQKQRAMTQNKQSSGCNRSVRVVCMCACVRKCVCICGSAGVCPCSSLPSWLCFPATSRAHGQDVSKWKEQVDTFSKQLQEQASQ